MQYQSLDPLVEVRHTSTLNIAFDHCKFFDLGILAKDPKLNECVQHLFEDCFFSRQRKERIKAMHNVIAVLLRHRYLDPSLFTVVSMDNNNYKRSDPNSLSPLVPKAIHALSKAGYVNLTPGFIDRERGVSRCTRIIPTGKLIALWNEYNLSWETLDESYVPQEDKSFLVLRKKDPSTGQDIDVEFRKTPRIEEIIASMERYNKVLNNSFIDIPSLEQGYVVQKHVYGRSLEQVNIDPHYSRRIFNRGSFDFLGRLYGGFWQSTPSELRKEIYINDHPTVELDFTALHPVMLYALEGISYWNDISHDPYQIDCLFLPKDAELARAIVKKLFMLMLNAKTQKDVFPAFRDAFPIGSQQRKYTDHMIRWIMSAIKKKHKLIAHYFCTDMGVRLMNMDSNIAEYVINHFTAQNTPVPSVHDSFIIDRRHMSELEEIMRKAFHQVMGVELGGQAGEAIKSNWSPSEVEVRTSRTDRYIRNLQIFCIEKTKRVMNEKHVN